MDVVALAQAGIAHCVGTLGTACTAAQLGQLFELAPRVVFCFDGDAAGRRAAAKALETVLPLATAGRSIKFAFLPEGHDPDSYVREFGGDAFEETLQRAMPLQAFLAELVTAECDLGCAEGRVRCASLARSYWRAMPAGRARDSLRDFCAGVLRVPPADVEQRWGAQCAKPARVPVAESHASPADRAVAQAFLEARSLAFTVESTEVCGTSGSIPSDVLRLRIGRADALSFAISILRDLERSQPDAEPSIDLMLIGKWDSYPGDRL